MAAFFTRLLFGLLASAVSAALANTAIADESGENCNGVASNKAELVLDTRIENGFWRFAFDGCLQPHSYEVELAAGDRIAIDMESVDGEIDPVLRLFDEGGKLVTENDDRSTVDLNSHVEYEAKNSGVFRIIAGQRADSEGDYVLLASIHRKLILPHITSRVALLLTINDYPGHSSDLPAVEADAELMRRTLKTSFGWQANEIVSIQNEYLTRTNLLELVDWLQSGDEPLEQLLIYYSGHGTRLDSVLNEAELDGYDDALVLYDSLLIDDEINILANSGVAEVVSLIIDSCHSGTALRGATAKSLTAKSAFRFATVPSASSRLDDSTFQDETIARVDVPSVHFLAAADETELAWTDDTRGVSFFTQNLADSVQNQSDVSVSVFMEGLRAAVADQVQAAKGVSQTVQYETASDDTTVGQLFGAER